MNDDPLAEFKAIEREYVQAKQAFDAAEREMINGWKQGLPDRELAELVERKNRAWNHRENVISRLKSAAFRATP